MNADELLVATLKGFLTDLAEEMNVNPSIIHSVVDQTAKDILAKKGVIIKRKEEKEIPVKSPAITEESLFMEFPGKFVIIEKTLKYDERKMLKQIKNLKKQSDCVLWKLISVASNCKEEAVKAHQYEEASQYRDCEKNAIRILMKRCRNRLGY